MYKPKQSLKGFPYGSLRLYLFPKEIPDLDTHKKQRKHYVLVIIVFAIKISSIAPKKAKTTKSKH